MSVWSDAAFLWNPGDSGTDCFDIVSGLPRGERFTQGTVVTHSGRTGRSYGTSVGETFGLHYNGLTDSCSFFAVTRLPSGSGSVWNGLANSADPEQYVSLATNSVIGGSARFDAAATPGGSDWPAVTDTTSSTDFLVQLVTLAVSTGTTGTLTYYKNSTTAVGSDTWSTSSPLKVDTVGVGVLADSSPSYTDSSAQVFAAAMWPRVLASSEIEDVMNDPWYVGFSTKRHMHRTLVSLRRGAIRGF